MLTNFNNFFYIFYYCQIRRGCRQNGSFLVLQKPLLVHICVMVWTLFIVFSFYFSTKSIIFGDHTRPQHQETTKIVNLESLVLGVVKNHNCWFTFCVMVRVIIQCLFNHLHYVIWWLAHLQQQETTLKFLPHALRCCNQNILNNIKTNKKKAISQSTEKFYKVLVLFYGLTYLSVLQESNEEQLV